MEHHCTNSTALHCTPLHESFQTSPELNSIHFLYLDDFGCEVWHLDIFFYLTLCKLVVYA